MIFFISLQHNDDEAERAIRRRTLGKSSANTTLNSDSSLVEEHEGLKNCLKIFQDNVSIVIYEKLKRTSLG